MVSDLKEYVKPLLEAGWEVTAERTRIIPGGTISIQGIKYPAETYPSLSLRRQVGNRIETFSVQYNPGEPRSLERRGPHYEVMWHPYNRDGEYVNAWGNDLESLENGEFLFLLIFGGETTNPIIARRVSLYNILIGRQYEAPAVVLKTR